MIAINAQISHPPKLTTENKFNWEAIGESGQYMFNYLYEYLERNQHRVFATDLFKLDGFSNEQVMIVQKIIDAAKFNVSAVAASFLEQDQCLYDEEGRFNPE